MERGGIWFSKENVKVESRKFCSLQEKKKNTEKEVFLLSGENQSTKKRNPAVVQEWGE